MITKNKSILKIGSNLGFSCGIRKCSIIKELILAILM